MELIKHLALCAFLCLASFLSCVRSELIIHLWKPHKNQRWANNAKQSQSRTFHSAAFFPIHELTLTLFIATNFYLHNLELVWKKLHFEFWGNVNGNFGGCNERYANIWFSRNILESLIASRLSELVLESPPNNPISLPVEPKKRTCSMLSDFPAATLFTQHLGSGSKQL